MINTDYPIAALKLLLDRACISDRYASLVPLCERLCAALAALGCRTKSDAAALSEQQLLQAGLPDGQSAALFRRMLSMYDPDPHKFGEIGKVARDPEERSAFEALYHLPGVKAVRASLYYQAGYRTLADVANTTVEEVQSRTSEVIRSRGLCCTVPLPKEIRTHVAVARAFTMECPEEDLQNVSGGTDPADFEWERPGIVTPVKPQPGEDGGWPFMPVSDQK